MSELRESVKRNGMWAAAGLGTAVAAGELLVHRDLAHRTLRLGKALRVATSVLGWTFPGADPVTMAAEHRVHHGEGTKPKKGLGVLRGILGDGFVSQKRALADVQRAPRGAIAFDGMDTANDPVIKYDADGNPIALKYEDWPSNVLSKLPRNLGSLVIPAAVIGVATLHHSRKHSPGKALRMAATGYSAYFLAMAAPGFAPTLPEHMRGGEGSELGVDVGFDVPVLPWPTTRHHWHHEHPAEGEPPDISPFAIDHVLVNLAVNAGLATTDPDKL